jgi:hypothetical protein
MLVAGTNMQDINVLKKKLANSFVMKDLGVAKKILGMRITRDRKNHKLTLSQGEYTENVLEIFRMQNAKPVSTPVSTTSMYNFSFYYGLQSGGFSATTD